MTHNTPSTRFERARPLASTSASSLSVPASVTLGRWLSDSVSSAGLEQAPTNGSSRTGRTRAGQRIGTSKRVFRKWASKTALAVTLEMALKKWRSRNGAQEMALKKWPKASRA